jgi:glycosyltransferase involved in cell wall biosynthesis
MPAMRPDSEGAGRGEILLVTDRRFWDASIGSEQRIAALIRYLRRRGLPLAVIYTGRLLRAERDALERFQRSCGGLTVIDRRIQASLLLRDALERLGARLRRGGNSVAASPAGPLEHNSPGRRAFVGRVIRQRSPRVVIVEFTRLASLVWPRPAMGGAEPQYWLDLHDLLHERAERTRGQGFRPAVEVDRETELRAISHFDLVIAIQAREAETLRQLLPESTILLVPHGIDLPEAPSSTPAPASAVMRIGFLGGRDPSNGDALDWFVGHVWPPLRAALGDRAELVVAGQICERWTAPRRDGITIRGPVASIDEFWPQIDVAINPVRFGSGLKIKNVEALAFGRALLTTPVGALGLEDASPHGLRIAEEPADWIETLRVWQEDGEARQRIGARGQAFATERLSETAAYGELARRLEALL